MMAPSPNWSAWTGREEVRCDTLSAAPVQALAASLNRGPAALLTLPPLWHWLYFWPLAQQSELGVDGHPQRGGFLPPIPLPRRMWAGGRLRFARPLALGAEVTRRSTILKVEERDGRSGPLVFVTVQHEISDAHGVAIAEEQDIVYRDAPVPGAPAPAPRLTSEAADFSRPVVPDPVLLFRYSALTFNGHRIHYDRPYAMNEEGYPGLVVHGPLTASLLMELLQQQCPDQLVRHFDFRGVAPLFAPGRFLVCGKHLGGNQYRLWAQAESGAIAMEASAGLGEVAAGHG